MGKSSERSPRKASRSRSKSPRKKSSERDRRKDSRSPPRRRERSRSRSPRRRSRSRSRSRGRGGGGGDRETGVSVRWNVRGFGFIQPDKGGDEVFCHVSAIKDGNALTDGGKVEFDRVWDNQRGKELAGNVTGGFREEQGNTGYDGGARGGGGAAEHCFDFQKGRCTRGSSCRFSHGDGGEGRGGGRSRSRSRGRRSRSRSRGRRSRSRSRGRY